MSIVIRPEYDHYLNLPKEENLFNPLIDVKSEHREDNELIEFYKLCNEYYSPEFGIRYLLNSDLYPYQMAIIRAILAHKFPILLLSRGAGKTWIIAVYSIYHAIMYPGSRIVLISASFRQSKLIFAEIQRIYDKSPLLRAIADDQPRTSTDRCHFELCNSSIKALPLGTGDKIRGERGHVILTDEFDSVPIEIFDVVVRGFGATQSDPWAKTRMKMIDDLDKTQKEKGIKKDNAMTEFMLAEGNKLVLSGTAGFKNGTFYTLFNQYAKILENQVSGKASQYGDLFDEKVDDKHQIDYRDYCILKMTYLDLPLGMMDLKMIDHASATMPKMLFNMEYMAEFGDDTFGFFKMRDIEAATTKDKNITVLSTGRKSKQYIMGVDPARNYDRFAIVLIEVGSPNRLVYSWTQQKEKYSTGAAKMRQLIRDFNIVAVAMDEGGGGLAVEELLNSSDVLSDGDHKIYRYDDETPESSDGIKNLYMFNFSSANWIDESNALLQKNIEDKNLIFPYPVTNDEYSEVKDDIIYEIGELKQELAAIEVTHTKTGRKRFDLAPPDITRDTSGAVKHKDRYSALLLANFLTVRFADLNYDEKAKAKEIYGSAWQMGGWLENIS